MKDPTLDRLISATQELLNILSEYIEQLHVCPSCGDFTYKSIMCDECTARRIKPLREEARRTT